MNRMIVFQLAGGIALLLGVSSARAQSGYPSDDNDDDRYQDNAPRYQNAPPPQGQASADLPRIADRMVSETAEIQNQIRREVPPDQGGRQAYEDMARLQRQAQAFERAVDNLGPGAEPTRAEFSRLTNAYARAANSVEALQQYPDIYGSFAHVQHLMDRAAPAFGGYQSFGYGYSNHGYQMRGPGVDIDGVHIGPR